MNPVIVIVGSGVCLLTLSLLIWLLPFAVSLKKARAVGIELSLLNLIGMKLRLINPRTIVDALIILKKGGVEVKTVYRPEIDYNSIGTILLETHYLAGGNPILISERYVSEYAAGKEPDIMNICAEDLKEVYGGEQTDEPAPDGQSS